MDPPLSVPEADIDAGNDELSLQHYREVAQEAMGVDPPEKVFYELSALRRDVQAGLTWLHAMFQEVEV